MARLQVNYVNKSENFFQKNIQEFDKQYAHIYTTRLVKLYNFLEKNAKSKWGNDIPVKKLFELNEDEQEQCIVIGTLYKDQELKPSILKEISEENQLAPPPPKTHFADESDTLILEDDLQRIRLEGKVDVHNMVTGVCVAVKGYIESGGRFIVDDLLSYDCGPQVPLKELKNSPLVVFISGLDLSNKSNNSFPLELFEQWIYGNLEMQDDKDSTWSFAASNIVRIIIAGNSISSCTQREFKSMSTSSSRPVDTAGLLDSVRALDKFATNLVKSVEVDIMPGEYDPSNCMMPQQPMHHCLFPKSGVNKSFNGVTNPYQFSIDDRIFLGTSGQNIDDIKRYSKIVDSIDALESTLKWGHIAPTCPDTLPCYPYYDKDPFIITECPHIYFTGNCDEFQTELYSGLLNQKVRLIAVPSFGSTNTVAVLNLSTLECKSLTFSLYPCSEE